MKITPTIEQVRLQLGDSSRALADLTASMVYDEPSLLKALFDISWEGREPWCNRASRVISICAVRFPELVKDNHTEMIRKLKHHPSESVRRNLLKVYCEIPLRLKKNDMAALLDMCFDFFTGPYSIGVRAYSMQILYRLSLELPDIQRELYATIEEQMPEASAGLRSQGIKIMKKIAGSNVNYS